MAMLESVCFMEKSEKLTSLAPRAAIIKSRKARILALAILGTAVILVFFFSLFVGTSSLSFVDAWNGLFGNGSTIAVSIMRNIRLPRVLAGLIAGAGLGLSGLIMQSTLKNPMASPSTLGVSNAAVLGANIALIILGGGSIAGNGSSSIVGSSSYSVTAFAFLFSLLAIVMVLALSSFRGFSANSVVLAGIALGSMFSATTTLIQYFASDTQLSAAVYWTFGDLGRATFQEDWIMLVVVAASTLAFMFLAPHINAISTGEETAYSLGVNVRFVRFLTLFLASLITACCIAFLGIIGFIGIIAPHTIKRTIGHDHRYSIIGTALSGSLFLLLSDVIARVILQGTSLPVGAITALVGAPFFLYIIFSRKEREC